MKKEIIGYTKAKIKFPKGTITSILPPQKRKSMKKEITLNFIEYATYKSKDWNPETHIAARIEILESDKEYHVEEIELRIPKEIYYALRAKLDGMEINI